MSTIANPERVTPAISIAGPTAVGKTAVALALAGKVNGEIISVDSMQVYRGLDIGTAKPSADELARVPHHLIDVMELTEPFDAAKFVELAHRAEQAIRARGRVPIFCGGTGLYFKALLEGLGEAPPADERVRAELERLPMAALLDELQAGDPETFSQIDRKNPRRVIRAVEVIRLTGKPFSAQRAQWKPAQPASSATSFGLRRETEDLRERIDRRVDEMFARGLVEETRALLESGLEHNRTAMQAIGYRQVVEHLRGERSLSDTVTLIKIKTRQFARRQMTWFKRQLQLNWIDVAPGSEAQTLAGQITDLRSR